MENIRIVISWVLQFIREKLYSWLIQQGGWVSWLLVLKPTTTGTVFCVELELQLELFFILEINRENEYFDLDSVF